jgi:hypothetical protein
MQYDQYQRAYVFEKQDGAPGPLSFELAASEKTPVVNVAVVIKNWGAAPAMIQVNGKTMQSDQGSAQGLVRTLETDDRVIWIPLKSNSAVKVEIRPVLGTNLNGVLPKPHKHGTTPPRFRASVRPMTVSSRSTLKRKFLPL